MKNTEKIPLTISILSLIAIILMIYFFFGITFSKDVYVVNGVSMLPTYKNGERLYYETNQEINRYDVVIFQDYTLTTNIKRVYGLPGETIQIKENNIYINDKKIEDKWNITNDWDGGIAETKFTLKENEFFVLGDNRNKSTDSRHIELGTVNRKLIIGVVEQK